MPLAASATSFGVIRLRVSTPSVMTTTALRWGSPDAPDFDAPATIRAVAAMAS